MSDLFPRVHLYPAFREIDAISYAMRTGFLGLGAGTFSACMKSAYFSTRSSPWTVISVYGGTIPIYAAVFGTYGLTKASLQNFRRAIDGWNEFAGGAAAGVVWGAFRRQGIANIIAVAVFAGTSLGVFSWAGGFGGFSSIAGLDIHKALEYRRKFRYYPNGLIPLEVYERAIGRKAHPEDFADIDEVMGLNRFDALENEPTDVVGIIPVKKPDQQWWKDVLEKSRAKEEQSKK